jgi:hypothetical protein
MIGAKRLWYCLAASCALTCPACGWDGHFSICGYSTRPNYDTGIRTVLVPIFKNDTMARGLEFDLTRAVIRDIEAKTPYKVASETCRADSELLGKIVRVTKTVVNANQINEIRTGQVVLGVELIWRDLRPDHVGEILSAPRQGGAVDPKGKPLPVLVMAMGDFAPELGGSSATAYQEAVNRLAVQIISMMEKPW